MSRSLNSPLFDDADFENAEQGVREALAMKARTSSVDMQSQRYKHINENLPDVDLESKVMLVDDNIMDVKGIIGQLLNDSSQKVEPVRIPSEVNSSKTFTSDAFPEIPEFLKRDTTHKSTVSDTNHAYISRYKISWKVPYVFAGVILTLYSQVTGMGYSTLFTFITMLPLVDIQFYKSMR